MISIKDLHKSYGNNKVLKGITLDFTARGMISAILGPNGSGKTTLIKCLLGMVIPQKGELLVQGDNIKGKWDYRTGISYLPQIARFPENLTVNEIFHLIRDIRGGDQNESELIQRFDLEPHLDQKFRQLSGGTKQKVNLTIALMYDSPILILDEPTSGLDPVALIQLKEILNLERAKGKLILMTTHIMSFVEEMADELVFIMDGKIHVRQSIQSVISSNGDMNLEQAIARILGYEEEDEADISELLIDNP